MVTFPKAFVEAMISAAVEFFQSTGMQKIDLLNDGHQIALNPQEVFSASLGFNGEKIRGAVIVTTYAAALAATNPQREFNPNMSNADHADWIGEMSNQIVGNLKRNLAAYGIVFGLSTPTVVTGKQIDVPESMKSKVQMIQVKADDFKVKIHFTVDLDPTIDFSAKKEQSDQAQAGDAMLF